MDAYLENFMAGVRADVHHLVSAEFQTLDPNILHDLFDSIIILRIAQKTLPPSVWEQSATHRNGLVNYKRMNAYLESYMGARQKAELALRRQWTVPVKQRVLSEYVGIHRLVKGKDKTQGVSKPAWPSPIVGGATSLSSNPIA